MKVGVFFDEYTPEDGGAFTMQGDLLRALCARQPKSSHEFVVISRPSTVIQAQAEQAGLEWLAYRGPGLLEKMSRMLAYTFPVARRSWRSSFERRLRKLGVEFVWFTGPRPLDLDLPYLTIALDLQHRKQPWFPEVSEYSEWETRERRLAPFLRRAAAIIAGTQAGREELVQFFQIPAQRIHILPHPTPAYALDAAQQKRHIDAQSEISPGYLLYPAQYWAHKNHANLLLALKQLHDEGVKIPLVLVGSDFGNRAYVQGLIAQLGLTDKVHVLGFVESATLVSLYQNALALVYPSFFGPENLPPLEAFALGCPVIAADVDGAKEQLGGAALLVDPADPFKITDAIRKLHKNRRLRATLIAKGKKRAKQWTAENFVQGVFEILDGFAPIRRTWKG